MFFLLHNFSEVWHKTTDQLKRKINKPSFETWFQSTKANYKNDTVYVYAINPFAQNWLKKQYTQLIKDIILQISDKNVEVLFVLPEEYNELFDLCDDNNGSNNDKFNYNNNSNGNNNHRLNSKYTFDKFVIGAANRFAHAAAYAVAESPAKAYNPLFIYGGVGLGKTHLLQAIGHYIMDNRNDLDVLYISSEKFTNEFIFSIRENKTVDFRNRYRNVDILLIDDIQFLTGKEQTQEEFFHTFNALYEEGKQIVITSDRLPKEIPTLEDRLRSRFEMGLTTDIQAPDLETRIAILQKKARAEQLDISRDVMVYIANKISTNIRELEGALIRVVAYSSLENKDIDIKLATEALKHILEENNDIVNVPKIQEVVSSYFQLPLEDLKGKKRSKAIAYPRQIAMYLSRTLTDYSLPRIGAEFGGRDHSTVIHACDKITKLLLIDKELQKIVNLLSERIT